MALDFKRGPSPSNELYGLSDVEKRSMCIDLLEEFGANNIVERGDELIHSCCLPFGQHANGDASASASLNWRKMAFNCFGCGNSGGLYWFIAVNRGETMAKVRDWASARTALGDEDSLASLLRYLDSLYNPQGEIPAPPIPKFNPAILEPWRKIHPYLTEMRHIPVENIVKHQVGYDDSAERIIFPLFWRGDLVGWQSRRIFKDGTAKYLNTPDFPRDRTLYNIDVKSPSIVVVESPMTVLSKTHLNDQYGFVATFGAKVTKEQLKLLASNGRITLWFDNDAAGWGATDAVAESLLNYADVFVVPSPWDEDAGGLDDATTTELLKQAVPYNLWRPPTEIREWSKQ